MTRVAVVDYGLGNLFSVSRALERVGASPEVTDSPAVIEAASCLVLPGVGAFRDGMEGLHARRLVEPLRRYGASGRALLGICLGMQLLFEMSEEFGANEGLGLIPGGVIPIPCVGNYGRAHKIPHIGWNEVRVPTHRQDWDGTILGSTTPGTAVYFVHSYNCVPADAGDLVAYADYDGCAIAAAVQRAQLSGLQFHPEKSGARGLAILREFVAATRETQGA